MKKTFLKSVIAIVFLTVFTIFSLPVKANNSNITSSGIPDSLMKVFKRACIDCHSDGGNFMAASKVNFANWNSYNKKKQAKKAGKIFKELSKDKMPPESWRKGHEKAIPTKNEVESIGKWATSLHSGK